MKRWIVFARFMIGGIGLLFLTQDRSATKIDLSQVNKDAITTPSEQNGQVGDHIVGDTNAKVVLVVYGDYQCSACSGHNQKLIDLAESYESGFAMTYRHFPIPGHSNARAAAAAAEAAGKQGKFWEMHNKLFQNYLYWGTDVNQRDLIFQDYAEQLELDINQFKQDVASQEVKQKIDFDTALGQAHELVETPTLVLNGEKLDVETWSDDQKLKDAIKKHLDKDE